MQKPGGKVQSFDRALNILNAFDRDHGELGVSELARITGLTRSTTHRLLMSLQEHELVQQSPTTRRYSLGPHILRLAHVALAHVRLESIALPVMSRLRDQCQETVGLHLPQGDSARIVVSQVESRHALRRSYTDIGQPIPIYQGAPGKVLLAYHSEAAWDRVLSQPLEAVTPRSITDPHVLRAELARVRAQGYALSIEERTPDISTLAVPIFNHTDHVAAALSVTGPTTRLPLDRLMAFIKPAVEAASEISKDLGYLEGSVDEA